MESLSIYSLNCRGLNSTERRTKLFTWFADINADIILLQESHFIEKYKNNTMLDGLENTFIIFRFTTLQGNIHIISKKIDIDIINVHKSNDGKILLLNLIFEENFFSIMNIYAPNSPSERQSFFYENKKLDNKTLT